jgi:hypothetical protein
MNLENQKKYQYSYNQEYLSKKSTKFTDSIYEQNFHKGNSKDIYNVYNFSENSLEIKLYEIFSGKKPLGTKSISNSFDNSDESNNIAINDISLDEKEYSPDDILYNFQSQNNNLFLNDTNNINNQNMNISNYVIEPKNEIKNENNKDNNNIIINNNKNIIINNNNNRKDLLIKKVIKTPFIHIKSLIEKLGNIKLKGNLNSAFGSSFAQYKAALDLTLYKIFTTNKENKKIIEEAKPNKENKELFYNLLKTKCKIIYDNYVNNQKNFFFKEKIVEITKFKTLDDIMKENIENKNKKRKIKRKSENKIKRKYVKSNEPYGSEFKKESLELIKHLSDGYFDPRNAKRKNIFIIFKTIPKLEEYIEK